jgi:hypothetical protein
LPNSKQLFPADVHIDLLFSDITNLAGRKGMFLSLGRIQRVSHCTVLLPEERRRNFISVLGLLAENLYKGT